MEEDSLYDFAEPAAAKPHAPEPETDNTSPPPAVKLAYQSLPSTKISADIDTIKNLQMPLWLLGGGIVIEIVSQLLYERGRLASALMDVGMQLVIGTAALLAGVLLSAKLRQIKLGAFPIVLLKVAALSVAPSAALALVWPGLSLIPLGVMLGLLGEFIFYFALLGALFDLDESDTWYCIWMIFAFRMAAYIVMRLLGA